MLYVKTYIDFTAHLSKMLYLCQCLKEERVEGGLMPSNEFNPAYKPAVS